MDKRTAAIVIIALIVGIIIGWALQYQFVTVKAQEDLKSAQATLEKLSKTLQELIPKLESALNENRTSDALSILNDLKTLLEEITKP